VFVLYPDDHEFPNIDSIIKLVDEDCHPFEGYLQMTGAQRHHADLNHIKRMNNIFEGCNPAYIVVCPDAAACKNFCLKHCFNCSTCM
jgi:hypothetical protein